TCAYAVRTVIEAADAVEPRMEHYTDPRRVERAYRHFFFSSRRRHTRSKRDWSSDVALPICILRIGWVRIRRIRTMPGGTLRPRRSEERRVGKERRGRWRAGPEGTKKPADSHLKADIGTSKHAGNMDKI